jgi:hypothetical protein
MRKAIRISLTVFVVVVVLAQAVRINMVNPPIEGDVTALPPVDTILRRACYDCHSNQTVWPWYSQVAPVSWLLAHDVKEGRRELNFSKWSTYDAKKRTKKRTEIAKEVGKGAMPPWYYVLVHSDAHLADADRETLRAWTVEKTGELPG